MCLLAEGGRSFNVAGLMKGCPILLLEGQCPAEISSNLTFAWKLIKLVQICLIQIGVELSE